MRPSIGWIAGALLLAGVLVVATHLAEERELARLALAVRPLWLLVGASLQALTYVCAAAVWQRALARHATPLRLRALLPLGLAKLFTDQAVPSAGMSGTLLVVHSLQRRGASRSSAVAAVLVGLVAFYLAYAIATLAAIAILRHQGHLRTFILIPALLLCLLAAGLPAALVTLRRETVERLPRWTRRLPFASAVAEALREAPRAWLDRRVVVETTALQLAIFVLDALTLAATLHAAVPGVELAATFASFVIASVVATLAWIPGGLGTFEGTCVAMLRLQGVPLEAALAATLLFRGLSFWLPMLPGLALARRELGGPRNPS